MDRVRGGSLASSVSDATTPSTPAVVIARGARETAASVLVDGIVGDGGPVG